MSELKKPTLEQMKERPTLWITGEDWIHIKYPNGKSETYYHFIGWDQTAVHFDFQEYIDQYDFLGFL